MDELVSFPSPSRMAALREATSGDVRGLAAPVYDAGMDRPLPKPTREAVASVARATAGLDLLILFGSRARGDARPGADWDFGYLADEAVDVPGLLAALVEAVGNDRVDLVDLRRAGGLLRFRAACDGVSVYEASAERFDRYRLQAVQFWCDNAPVFERGYDEVLETLPS